MPAMRIALIARPQWEDRLPVSAGATRLINAPLQLLQCVSPDPRPFAAIGRASNPWVVFTSPASVEAMDHWIGHTGMNPLQLPALQLAAVGSGTAQAITEMGRDRATDSIRAWPIDRHGIVVSASDERADAAALMQALDDAQQRRAFTWREQTFLLAQGEANRTTLADGLRERGAQVIALAMYRRNDVTWPQSVWQMLAALQAGECGVVVTSSTVIARLMQDLADHGIAASQLVWCTQHAAIAEKLRSHGIAAIRRVALSAASLEKDLFEHEQYW